MYIVQFICFDCETITTIKTANCSSSPKSPLASLRPSVLPLSFPGYTDLFFCHYSLAYISGSFISTESPNMYFSLVSNYFSLSYQTSSLFYPPHPLAKVPGVGWFSACPLLTEEKQPLVQLLSSVVSVNWVLPGNFLTDQKSCLPPCCCFLSSHPRGVVNLKIPFLFSEWSLGRGTESGEKICICHLFQGRWTKAIKSHC